MGKCVSKDKSESKASCFGKKKKKREDEIILTSIQTEGPRNQVFVYPRTTLMRKNVENLETQEDQSSLQKSILDPLITPQLSDSESKQQEIRAKRHHHHRSITKISLDFDQISQLQTEQSMLLRISKSLHELARAYHREENYFPSLELLHLSGEIYMHLGMYDKYNITVSDLILATIMEFSPALNHQIPVVVDPMDERTTIIVNYWNFATHKEMTVSQEILKKYSIGNIANLLEAAKKYDNSRIEYKNLPDSLIEIAHMFRIWLGSPCDALNFYEEALILDPENSKIHLYLGLTYKALGNIEKTINHYINGININPDSSDCYFNLGNIYCEELHDYEEAEKCYIEALNALKRTKDSLVTADKINDMLKKIHILI
ncbi:unnamed protein product [Blepharisma stoltei]|uniref:Tetratricopeptide repeat protein n=1 Tax=Blepharisma stoltei TaxID=1481888 RepID=A0AAU9J4F1_9CILI|nr:unnamed protein product [Blepharisma stoltei]